MCRHTLKRPCYRSTACGPEALRQHPRPVSTCLSLHPPIVFLGAALFQNATRDLHGDRCARGNRQSRWEASRTLLRRRPSKAAPDPQGHGPGQGPCVSPQPLSRGACPCRSHWGVTRTLGKAQEMTQNSLRGASCPPPHPRQGLHPSRPRSLGPTAMSPCRNC